MYSNPHLSSVQMASSKVFNLTPVTSSGPAAPRTAKEEKNAAKAELKLDKARDFIDNVKAHNSRPVDKVALKASMDALKEIHDSKTRRLPDLTASFKYERESNRFFKAIGVDSDMRHRAERAAASSGVAYAASQVPIAVTRLIPVAIRQATTVAAKAGLTLTRGVTHAGIGAGMKPFADAVADLTKDGQPAPTFMGMTSRSNVLSQMKRVNKLAAKVIQSCKDNGVKVPDSVVRNLERLKAEYTHRNAQGFVFGSFGVVSHTCELMKSALEDIANLLTGGTDPLVGAAVNTVTAGIYAISSPLEELAVLRTMITQTAKYADVLDKEGEIDEAKARNLWSTREQTKLGYIDKAAARRFADSINDMHQAQGRIDYLKSACEQPSVAATQINKQREKLKQEIVHLKGRIAEQEKFAARNDKRQIELLTELFEDESELPAEARTSLLSQFRPELERNESSLPQHLRGLLAEARTLPTEDVNDDPDEFTARDVLDGYEQTVGDLTDETATLLGDGKKQVTKLEAKLKALLDKQQALDEQHVAAQEAAAHPGDELKLNALRKLFNRQLALEQQKHADAQNALRSDMHDYSALKTAIAATSDMDTEAATETATEMAVNSMNKDGFVFRMMTSKKALISEAAKVRYTDPLIVEKLVAERVPLAVAIVGVQSWANSWAPAVAQPLPSEPVAPPSLHAGNVIANFKYTVPVNAGITAMQDRMADNNGAKLFMKLPPAPFSPNLTTALAEVGFTAYDDVPENLKSFDLGLNPHRFGHTRLTTESDSKLGSGMQEISAHALHSLKNVGESLRKTLGAPFVAILAKNQRHNLDAMISTANEHNRRLGKPSQTAAPENTASSLST